MSSAPAFMPALRFRWLTPFYDALIRCLLPERKFKEALLKQAHLQPGEKVLDIGCGTATLILLAARSCPDCQLTGIDADSAILRLASRKLQRNGLSATISLIRHSALQLPFPDAHFDKILGSLFFCNLLPEAKKIAMAEIKRVLQPSGELHIAEWGKPAAWWVRPGFRFLSVIGGGNTTADLATGQLPYYLADAGFTCFTDKQFNTLFGTIYLYSIRKSR